MKKNYPIYIAIVTLIVISVIFLWNEPFYIFYKEPSLNSLPFDADKFSTVVSIFAVVLNSLTIYLLYKQIEEMAEARKTTIKPFLIIEQFRIATKDVEMSIPETEDGFYTDETYKVPFFEKDVILVSNNTFDTMISLDIQNIGLGAAVNIEINWEYDTKKVYNIISQFYNIESPITSKNKYNISLIHPKSNSKINFPENYLYLFGSSVSNNVQQLANCPLILNLGYKDVAGNTFKQKFEIIIEKILINYQIDFKVIK